MRPTSHRVRSARDHRVVALAAALLVVLAACGQKPGVLEAGGGGLAQGDGGTGGSSSGDAGQLGVAPGDTTAPGGTVPAGSGGPSTGGAGPTGGGTSTGGGGTSTGGDGGGDGGGGGAPVADYGSKEIVGNEIVVGIHAPVTGAAPFPQETFNRGKDVYFKFINDKGGIHNRTVRVTFRDDGFNPSDAVRACREMVQDDKAMILVGGGGSDQIGACADYANTVGVPYLSAGVQQSGLDSLRGYFALSMTYSQQSPLLAQMAAKQFKGQKVAVVVADNNSLDDFWESSRRELTKVGITPAQESQRIPKQTTEGDALRISRALQLGGVQVVVFNGAPTSFIRIAQAGAGQNYTPRYIGPGVTNGLNTVALTGCPGVAGARFFSPFPQLDVIDQVDPDYKTAYRKYTGEEGDDIGIALWGLDKTIAAILEAAGPELSQARFVAALESGQPFATGVFPQVQFSPNNHFGGSAVHVLEADCNSRSYKTIGQNVSGF